MVQLCLFLRGFRLIAAFFNEFIQYPLILRAVCCYVIIIDFSSIRIYAPEIICSRLIVLAQWSFPENVFKEIDIHGMKALLVK